MLRPFVLESFAILKNWVVDEDLLFQFSAHGFTFPLAERQFEEYLDKFPDRQFYLAYDDDVQPYAFGEIIPQDKESVRLGRLLVGGKENRGKGLGTKLVNELLEEVKNNYSVKRVDLYVLENNQAAQKCYSRVGFKFVNEPTMYLAHKGQDFPVLKMRLEV